MFNVFIVFLLLQCSPESLSLSLSESESLDDDDDSDSSSSSSDVARFFFAPFSNHSRMSILEGKGTLDVTKFNNRPRGNA
uniref:Uncharacterized protein n=1 Tax=Pristionchus pacificus TaxID=54126 RepID=A0A2A6CT87_PRIPA|eukprot:PDM81359.1 hypothetical protein PRIPAC_35235 [Pristionchus pacificus]